MRKTILVIAISALTFSNAIAQGGETGVYVGGQVGYEVLGYSEYFTNTNGERAQLSGNSSSLAAAIALEYDFQKQFKLPLTIGLSAGRPLQGFAGVEDGTFVRQEQTFVSQREDVVHHYEFLRGTIGLMLSPVFNPFAIYERSLLESRRFNMLVGTDEGELIADPAKADWVERVWSSHVGLGFGGKVNITNDQKLSIRYRVAGMTPLAVFVTNDHPVINEVSGALGQQATGWTLLSRIALHYQISSRINSSLGVNYYYRRWNGDGAQTPRAYWPKNEMFAIPVLLGFNWSI